jgi:hypothetical protein
MPIDAAGGEIDEVEGELLDLELTPGLAATQNQA